MEKVERSASPPVWLKEQEVAQMIGMSLSSIRKWRMHNVNLPYHKIGKSVRYNMQGVVEFMHSRKIHANP